MDHDEWYYNLTTKQVVHASDAKAEERLGPFATREEAEHALERAAERNEAWDNDPKWNDPEDDADDEDRGPSAFDAFRP